MKTVGRLVLPFLQWRHANLWHHYYRRP